MSRIVTCGVCVLAVVFSSVAAAQPSHPPRDPNAEQGADWPGMVSVFHGYDLARHKNIFDLLVKMGFNATAAPANYIDACAKRNLRVFLIAYPKQSIEWAPKYRDSKIILSYYMSDRAGASKFPTFAGQEAQMATGDPNHPAIFTLCAELGLLSKMMQTVRPRAIEFYNYQWLGGYRLKNNFLYLGEHRAAALKAKVPLMRLLAVDPGPVKIRQTAYTSMAYGVRVLRWWDGWRFLDEGKKDKDGLPGLTPLGREVVRINAAVNAYAPVFKKIKSVGVYHSGKAPKGALKAPPGHWARPSGGNVVVGFFRDKKRIDYLLVANRGIEKRTAATITFNSGIKGARWMSRKSKKWRPLGTRVVGGKVQIRLPIAPGGGELISVKRG